MMSDTDTEEDELLDIVGVGWMTDSIKIVQSTHAPTVEKRVNELLAHKPTKSKPQEYELHGTLQVGNGGHLQHTKFVAQPVYVQALHVFTYEVKEIPF